MLSGLPVSLNRLSVLALVLGSAIATMELVAEPETFSLLEWLYDVVEKTLIVVGAGGVVILVRELRAHRLEQSLLRQALAVAHREGAEWRGRAQAHMVGLSLEIGRQFDSWQLTDAERQVAMLILKGMSHKEIAAMRGTAEATVRQQARVVYQKSGLPGKTAFSGYFLEDLLPSADLRGIGPGRAGEAAPVSARAPDLAE